MPGLWDDIDDLINVGELVACEEVLRELVGRSDVVSDWITARPQMIVKLDAAIQQAVSVIMAHDEHCKLVGKNATGPIADPFVVATAQVRNYTVVTNEILMTSPSPNKTKIPNVCRDLNIRYINFLDLIREQGWIYKR